MPRAPKQCGHDGCDQRVTGRTYCHTHHAETQTRANTTTRGYDGRHQAARRRALADLVDGDLCVHCRHPMHHGMALHLDHTPDRTGYRGLVHAQCNVRDGGFRRGAGSPPRPS